MILVKKNSARFTRLSLSILNWFLLNNMQKVLELQLQFNFFKRLEVGKNCRTFQKVPKISQEVVNKSNSKVFIDLKKSLKNYDFFLKNIFYFKFKFSCFIHNPRVIMFLLAFLQLFKIFKFL